MIKIEELTLKQYMWLKGMKQKDFTSKMTLSNIFNWGKNIGKFNKDYVGDKRYFPSNKTIKSIADTLGLTIDETKVLIVNQLEEINQLG